MNGANWIASTAIDGFDLSSPSSATEVLNPPTLSVARAFAGFGTVGGPLFTSAIIAGGEEATGPSAQVDGFSLNGALNTSFDLSDARKYATGFSLVSLTLGKYMTGVAGGFNANTGGPLDTVLSFFHSLEKLEFLAGALPKLTVARFALCSATVGTRAYLIGGSNASSGGSPSDVIDIVSLPDESLAPLKLNTSRFLCSAVPLGHLIYVAGGVTDGKNGLVDSVEVIDTRRNQVFLLPGTLKGGGGLVAGAATSQGVFFFGGGYSNGTGATSEFNSFTCGNYVRPSSL